jgi:hypothetical protein
LALAWGQAAPAQPTGEHGHAHGGSLIFTTEGLGQLLSLDPDTQKTTPWPHSLPSTAMWEGNLTYDSKRDLLWAAVLDFYAEGPPGYEVLQGWVPGLLAFNFRTGKSAFTPDILPFIGQCLAYDAKTDSLYAITSPGGHLTLTSIDLETGKKTDVMPVPFPVPPPSWDPSLDRDFSFLKPAAMAFHPRTHDLYITYQDPGFLGVIAKIDMEKQQAIVVSRGPDEVAGVAFDPQKPTLYSIVENTAGGPPSLLPNNPNLDRPYFLPFDARGLAFAPMLPGRED